MKFFEFEWGSRQGCVRELAEPDLPALLRYWHENPPEYLVGMGVDLRKLASPAETEARFRAALPSFGLRPELVHDPDPSGMARPGLFHQYHIVPGDISALAQRRRL